MKKRLIFVLFALVALTASAQTWEQVRDSEDYIYGEGWGSTVTEADKQALANLIGKIATNVQGESHSSLKTQNSNGQLNEESQFSQTVSTYSQATLTNTQQKVLKNEPDAYVVRWIKKSEIEKIFEARKRKALDLIETAVRAEKKGKVDDVLRNYYWALTLLKSLQYPNEVTYTDEDGKEHVCTNWCKEKIDDTFYELKTIYDSREGNDIRLAITYKGKPVNSVDYKFWDGQTWSAVYSAKDGWGVLELAPGFDGSQVQMKYEYEYAGEAKIDNEVEMVLNAVKGTPMPKAYTNVMLKSNEKKKEREARMEMMQSQSFTTNEVSIAPPKPIEKNVNAYKNAIEKMVAAVKQKDYDSARDLFTSVGWSMFTKLMKYGKAKVLDSQNIRFLESEDGIVERGLRMSFSFNSGGRATFVEDIVLTFNKEQKIDNISFGLGKTAEDDILNKGVWDEKSRLAIMNFLENYKTAYALKRLDYIRSIFDDDAVIITGSVVSRANSVTNRENQSSISQEGNHIIKMNRQTKDQYLASLKRCFERNEFVNIRFSDNDVKKMGAGGESYGESYGIQIQQDYYSSTYGDKGYLMLLVDINEPKKPLIKLRTWQPEKDPNFGLYEPGDF